MCHLHLKLCTPWGLTHGERSRKEAQRFPAAGREKRSGLCGDEIGSQGYYEYLAGHTAGWDLNARAVMDISKG